MTLPRTPSFRVDGRRALVTGGTRGIGLGAAVALAEAGAVVTLVARTDVDLAQVVRHFSESGFAADGVAIDITDFEAVRAFVSKREPYQVLVNSAGTARHSNIAGITPQDYQAVMDLNLAATIFMSQAVVGRLTDASLPGSIINVSSQMGHVGGPHRAVYSASKFALEGLTKSMAIELGPKGIRVNTVCPTFVETEMTARTLGDPDFRSWVLSKIKVGRLGRIEDLMGPIVFLASDAAAMVTGSALMVDGGWTAE